MNLRTIIAIVGRVYRDEGIRGVYTRVYRRLKNRKDFSNGSGSVVANPLSIFTKRDIIGFYDFVCYPDMGIMDGALPESATNVINWLIPDFGIGSGGHLNIFRFIKLLEKSGYKNNICLVGSHRHSSAHNAKELINKHFFELKADVYLGVEELPVAEFSFATGWTTAYFLRNFNRTKHKLYFVQDFEPYFYANGSEFAFAEQTYKFGFTGVCAGGWLATKLSNDYGMTTRAISFSYDRELYYPRELERAPKKRIFCYFRPPTIRRGLETALMALDIVGRNNPGVEFLFAGWDMNDFKFNHSFTNAGLLSLEELPDIYSKCDIALVLSFTNLSLLPLEIMACGCVVVSNEGPNVEWLLNSENSELSSCDPVELAKAINGLLADDSKIVSLREKGILYAESTDWSKEGDKLVNVLKGLTE